MLFLKRGCSSYADIGDVIRKARLGDYVVKNVPSLKHFQYKDIGNQDYDTESLVSLSYSMRLLVRWTLFLKKKYMLFGYYLCKLI